jgi:hypothetical protein
MLPHDAAIAGTAIQVPNSTLSALKQAREFATKAKTLIRCAQSATRIKESSSICLLARNAI